MSDAKPDFRLHRDPLGRLVYTSPSGKTVVDVHPVRLFPVSQPDGWMALCDADGKEVACFENLAALPEQPAELLRDALRRSDFLPVIHRILRVSAMHTPCQWDVETDRGRTHFLLDSEDDLHPLSGNGVLIRDASGTRFLIRDINALDAVSRRMLVRFL